MAVLRRLAVCLVLSLSSTVLALEPVRIADDEVVYLADHLEVWLPQPSANIALETVAERSPSLDWQPLSSQSMPRFNEAVHFRFRVDNRGLPEQKLVLNFGNNQFHRIDVLHAHSQAWVTQAAGLDLPRIDPAIDYRFYAFPLVVDADREVDVYLRINTGHAPLLNPSLSTPLGFAQQSANVGLIPTLGIGVLVGVGIYIGMLLLRGDRGSRAEQYYYLTFLLGTILVSAWLNGFLATPLGRWPWIMDTSYSVLVAIASIFHALFTRALFDTARTHRWIDRLLWMFILIHTTLLGVALLGYTRIAIPLTSSFTLLVMVVFPAISIYYQWRGHEEARFYTLAMISYSGCIGLTVSGSLGIIPYTLLVRHAYDLGIVLQAIFFSMAIAHRVNRYRREHQELEHKAELAAAESRAKSEFLARMSHEIRTPMNGVMGMAQLLSEQDLTPLQHKQVDVIRNSGQLLLSVINDILDYAKVESGRVELSEQPLVIDELITQSIMLFMPVAATKGLQFNARIQQPMPRAFWGDVHRIQQVINNLLNNAIKFTDQGEVSLHLHSEQIGDSDQAMVYFAISDSGRGISSEQMEKLFLPFQQGIQSTQGTGLGLSISRQLAELMGGGIAVTSTLGRGSTFSFRCPLRIDHARQHDLDRTAALLRGKSAALAYLDQNFRQGIRDHLQAIGMEVADFGSIKELLAYLEHHRPDIVVVNSSLMLDDDGARLLQDNHTLLVIQSILDPSVRTRFADTSLRIAETPRSLRDFEVAIAEALGLDVVMNHRTPVRAGVTAPSLAPEQKILVAEDNPVNQQVIGAMLKRLDLDHELVANGRQALNRYLQAPEHYALLLMDCEMPDMDGFDATIAIRGAEQERELQAIPIVALTAHALADTQSRCLQVGMQAVITKPIVLHHLVQVLGQYLGKH